MIRTIPLGIERGTWTTHIRIAPNGRYLYVTHGRDSRIAVVDCDPGSSTYHERVALIDTGAKVPLQFDFNAAGSLAVVTACESDRLIVIDTNPTSPRFNTVVDTYPTDRHPCGVVVQDRGETGPGTTVFTTILSGEKTLHVYRRRPE